VRIITHTYTLCVCVCVYVCVSVCVSVCVCVCVFVDNTIRQKKNKIRCYLERS